ncbi:MAG: ATP-binding protein [Gammaproteobacteria bacterium]|nr:ATP-binding protein [Gammaproteobacteria bacterium]
MLRLQTIRGWLFPDHEGTTDIDRQRLFVIIAALLAMVPLCIAAISEYLAGATLIAGMAVIGLVLMIANIAVARSDRFNLWPMRLVTVVAIVIITLKIYTDRDGLSLLWPVCVPPIVLFLYGRQEGGLWSLLLFVPCIALLGAPAPLGLPDLAGSALDFTLAYAICAGFAFTFETLRASASRAETERAEEVAVQQERFRDFADIASDWLFELDADLNFTYVSDNWARSLHLPAEALIGLSVTLLADSLVAESSDNPDEITSAFMAHEPFRDLHFTFRSPSRDLSVKISGKPFYTHDGGFAGYRGIAADFSDVAEREAELRDKDLSLHQAQKMEAVGQLTSGVAHDFNNLLTVIGGNLELLELTLQEAGIDSEQLLEAHAATGRAADLTSKLLAFSRRQPLVPQRVDVTDLVENNTSLVQRTLGEKIAMSVSSDPDLWMCKADVVQLESALLNLAINSRDAMPRGGELRINMINEPVDAGGSAGIAPGDYVSIEVGDSGEGIPKSVQQLVFDPFFSTKPQGQGSGLGLSMVYGFAKQSGGDVVLTSEEGVGTRVRIRLPRFDDAVEEAEQALDPAPKIVRGKKILVVEDEKSVRTLLRAMLERIGHEVAAAADRAEAERMFRESSPDLVVTDVVLANGESGVEFAAELRKRAPDQPILLISGYPDPLLDTEDELASRLPLLRKPFGATELGQAIAGLLSVR